MVVSVILAVSIHGLQAASTELDQLVARLRHAIHSELTDHSRRTFGWRNEFEGDLEVAIDGYVERSEHST